MCALPAARIFRDPNDLSAAEYLYGAAGTFCQLRHERRISLVQALPRRDDYSNLPDHHRNRCGAQNRHTEWSHLPMSNPWDDPAWE
jgi:hypothetical protein